VLRSHKPSNRTAADVVSFLKHGLPSPGFYLRSRSRPCFPRCCISLAKQILPGTN
jgi:hypothetical protein